MDRKDFLKKSVVGITGVVAAGVAVSNAATSKKNNIDNEVVGFNHIPAKNDQKMNTVLHKASTRGHANHGWLDSHHSFSFANYYNPERMGFGKLRVLNDDRVEASQGFGTHPHNNMEIISIPLEGDLEHKDSTGNVAVIKEGDIQVMSAGTGIFHSEYNKNEDKQVKFLQIWVLPNQEGVVPRYDQLPIDTDKMQNQFAQILSPNVDDEGVWIYQDAWFNMGKFDEVTTTTYTLNKEGNGVYAFILEGEAEIENQALETRDGFGVWDVESLNIKATKGAKILLMEVPMA